MTYAPVTPAVGGAERECGFFATRNIQNFVSSVEAGIGTEGQIMCVEQCTF